MKLRLCLVWLVLGWCSLADARPGFYLTLGGGYTTVDGQEVPYDQFGLDEFDRPVPRMSNGALFSTAIDGGSTLLYRMGFNILGYVAIETALSGHGNELADRDLRQLAAHWHLGARIYPGWHWQDQVSSAWRPLEASLFFGWGASYQVYVPSPELDEIGWDTAGSFRFGVGLEYFLLSYFKLSADYYYVNAPYDNFIFNYDDSENFPVDSHAALTGFHQFYVSMGFQFGSGSQPATAQEASLDL